MDYTGIIIEESLKDPSVLQTVRITNTRVEPVTEDHRTPWLKQWTLHTVTVPIDRADQVAEQISLSLANNYWYADFKNKTTHYIMFPGKIFKINRREAAAYQAATDYGLALGIPDYQLDFSPLIVTWERD